MDIRDLISKLVSNASLVGVAAAVNEGRADGFSILQEPGTLVDKQDQLGAYQYSAIMDDRTCKVCQDLDGRYFKVDDPQVNEVYPPIHPNCLVGERSRIYTSKGWKQIQKVKVGDLVLTHKKRFRKVVQTHRNFYNGRVVKIWFDNGHRFLSVTEDHPVLVDGKWIAAKHIKKGDGLSILGRRCARCGKVTTWDRKYCSRRCLSLSITDGQWSSEEHRKKMSLSASSQMKRNYADGTRDRYAITRKANQAMRRMVRNGQWNHVNPEGLIRYNKSDEGRRQSSERMRTRNPSTMPEVRKRMTETLKARLLKFPETHPNRVMSRRGFMSSIERKMKELLDALHVSYEMQHPIGQYFVDFAIPSLSIAIEVDGDYWHNDPVYDHLRQSIIESYGWHVIRFRERQINKEMSEVASEVARIAANHQKRYDLHTVKVRKVEKWTLRKPRQVYNLSVEGDESFIAKGIVVHNCRCIMVGVANEELENYPVKFTSVIPQFVFDFLKGL